MVAWVCCRHSQSATQFSKHLQPLFKARGRRTKPGQSGDMISLVNDSQRTAAGEIGDDATLLELIGYYQPERGVLFVVWMFGGGRLYVAKDFNQPIAAEGKREIAPMALRKSLAKSPE